MVGQRKSKGVKKPVSKIQFVLTIVKNFYNSSCFSFIESGSAYRCDTQKVRVYYSKTMRADRLPVRKQLCVKPNCPHLKEGETKIKTLVKFTQNRRCKDTTRKMRSTSHTEEWMCDRATSTITVTKVKEESGVVGHPRCKAQHCTAVSKIF
jgi:hypothetical protein